MNNFLNKIYFITVIFFCLFFGQNVMAIDYVKLKFTNPSNMVCVDIGVMIKISMQKMIKLTYVDGNKLTLYNIKNEKCVSNLAATPPETGVWGTFTKEEMDKKLTELYESSGRIHGIIEGGEYCVEQEFLGFQGSVLQPQEYTDDKCENKKPDTVPTPPTGTEYKHCCDCTATGGGKINIITKDKEVAKCKSDKCTISVGVCAGVKDTSEIKNAAKKQLNPVGFLAGTAGVTQILGKIITFLLFPIGMFTMALYIWAGFLWMTAQGNSENVTKAKQILVWTTLGVVITLASYLIVDLVFSQILL